MGLMCCLNGVPALDVAVDELELGGYAATAEEGQPEQAPGRVVGRREAASDEDLEQRPTTRHGLVPGRGAAKVPCQAGGGERGARE